MIFNCENEFLINLGLRVFRTATISFQKYFMYILIIIALIQERNTSKDLQKCQ